MKKKYILKIFKTIHKKIHLLEKYFLVIFYIGFFEFFRLKLLKKYTLTDTILFSKRLKIADPATYILLIKEIFIDEIYKFHPLSKDPIILDCGANIGLASLYFKIEYPSSKIIAFEPDPDIFEILSYNFKSFGYHDISLQKAAVSTDNKVLSFYQDGATSGSLGAISPTKGSISVKSIRLKNILENYNKIDFLKIDIEGHEDVVIEDISDELKKVDYLFLEYHSCISNKQTLDKILFYLTNAGFRYYFKESDFKKNPFIERELFNNIDTVVNIFCYK